MKKIWLALTLTLFVIGCGTQNENLAKGKELIKSDKRRKEERAVREFKLALQQQIDNAEAHYLLGLYNSQEFMSRTQLIGKKRRSLSVANRCSSPIKPSSANTLKGSFLRHSAMTIWTSKTLRLML